MNPAPQPRRDRHKPEPSGGRATYGSRSERGTRVAALFYSLIELAKLAGLEPRAYLGEAVRRAIRKPGSVTLPRDFAGEIRDRRPHRSPIPAGE